jgi:hypothetical protein
MCTRLEDQMDILHMSHRKSGGEKEAPTDFAPETVSMRAFVFSSVFLGLERPLMSIRLEKLECHYPIQVLFSSTFLSSTLQLEQKKWLQDESMHMGEMLKLNMTVHLQQ